jgi:hypothetical protein
MMSKDILFETIDGALPENKDTRDLLFSISSERGVYPQCFFRLEDGSYEFIGLWAAIEVNSSLSISKIFDSIIVFIYRAWQNVTQFRQTYWMLILRFQLLPRCSHDIFLST